MAAEVELDLPARESHPTLKTFTGNLLHKLFQDPSTDLSLSRKLVLGHLGNSNLVTVMAALIPTMEDWLLLQGLRTLTSLSLSSCMMRS